MDRLTRPHPLRSIVSLAALACFLGAGPLACFGTTNVPPVGAEGSAFTPERDEQRLWDRARDEERQLRTKVAIYQDPLLDDYLNQVAQRLVPPQAKGTGALKVRVSTIKDPTLNAFTYPTGSIYMHTGLLARMENESQLAMVLGHEITHATGRHALEYERSARNKQLGFGIAALIGSVAVANAAGNKAEQGDISGAYVLNQVGNIMVGLGLQLAFLASVNGFGRELEREADEGGMRNLVAAGYDPREAPRVFELLQDDHGDKSKMEVFFFGNHPRLSERIDTSKELLKTRYSGVAGREPPGEGREFQMRTRVLVRDDALLNIEAGRYGVAESEIKKVLALTPKDPVAFYLYGRLHEKQASEARDSGQAARLEDKALAMYDEASRLDPRYADPYKSIGILRHKAGNKAAALAAFRRYLELKPDAQDAQQIRDYVLEIEAG